MLPSTSTIRRSRRVFVCGSFCVGAPHTVTAKYNYSVAMCECVCRMCSCVLKCFIFSIKWLSWVAASPHLPNHVFVLTTRRGRAQSVGRMRHSGANCWGAVDRGRGRELMATSTAPAHKCGRAIVAERRSSSISNLGSFEVLAVACEVCV